MRNEASPVKHFRGFKNSEHLLLKLNGEFQGFVLGDPLGWLWRGIIFLLKHQRANSLLLLLAFLPTLDFRSSGRGHLPDDGAAFPIQRDPEKLSGSDFTLLTFTQLCANTPMQKTDDACTSLANNLLYIKPSRVKGTGEWTWSLEELDSFNNLLLSH